MKKVLGLGLLLVGSLSFGQTFSKDSLDAVNAIKEIKMLPPIVEDSTVTKYNYANDVSIDIDKYTGEKHIMAGNSTVDFHRYINKGKATQYIRITIDSDYLSGYDNEGVIILFKNGKKLIRKNEKVDVDYTGGDAGWRYSVFYTPTASEIAMLKTNEIIGVKLYIFDKEIWNGIGLKEYAKLVLKSPIKKK